MGSCIMCSWEKPWVFREHAPRAPQFFQLCLDYLGLSLTRVQVEARERKLLLFETFLSYFSF